MNVSRKKILETLRRVYLFQDLDAEYIDLLLENVEVVFFQSDKLVYLEKSPASYFYTVLQGEVEILKEKNHTLYKLNTIKESNSFGEDAIIVNQKRRTSARATKDLILIKIDKKLIHLISSEIENFRKKLNVMLASYENLSRSFISPGINESIIYISRAHPISAYFKVCISFLVVLGLSLLMFLFFKSGFLTFKPFTWGIGILSTALLLWSGWQFVEWSNDVFYFTDKRIVNQQRSLLSFEIKQDIPLSAIESTQEVKSFFGRGMNFGNLEIRTFTGSMKMNYVPEIPFVLGILQSLVKKNKEFAKEEEKKEFERSVRERITKGDLLKDNKFDRPSTQSIITQVPFQKNESISYSYKNDSKDIILRTHWTILIAKTLTPALLLLSHILVFLFLIVNNISIVGNNFFRFVLGANCIFLFCWSTYRFFDWRNDIYIITEDQLIDVDRKPFGTEEKRTAPIKNIQSIRYQRNGIFGLLFNFGTVFTRVGDDEFTFDNVYRPSEVQEMLFTAKEKFHKKEQEIEKSSQQRQAVEWIDTYHQIITEEKEDGLNNPPEN